MTSPPALQPAAAGAQPSPTTELSDRVLHCNRLRDALAGWGELGATPAECRMYRLVVYGCVAQDAFTGVDVVKCSTSNACQSNPRR